MTGRQFYNMNRELAQEMLGLSDEQLLTVYEPWEFLDPKVQGQWDKWGFEQDLKDREIPARLQINGKECDA